MGAANSQQDHAPRRGSQSPTDDENEAEALAEDDYNGFIELLLAGRESVPRNEFKTKWDAFRPDYEGRGEEIFDLAGI